MSSIVSLFLQFEWLWIGSLKPYISVLGYYYVG